MGRISKEFLSLEQVNSLLSEDNKIVEEPVERSVYPWGSNDRIAVLNSKLYPQKYYWFSCVTDYFMEIGLSKVCFICGYEGFCIIPIDIIKKYNKYSGWKANKKGRSYFVRIRQRNGITYLFADADHEPIDITQYFTPIKID